MTTDAILHEAEALERALGDPSDESNALSFVRSVALDEASAFPAEPCEVLRASGYMRNLVPARDGGALDSFDRLLALGRVVARRDLTVAIATGQTLLGALPVWIAGEARQRTRVAELVLDGGAGCLALTEEAHGSELAAGEVAARRADGGFALHGTKWCINNATRGVFLSVLARTADDGGPRGHSSFLVDKARVPASTLTPIAPLRTHGIRGADISGVAFDGTPLAEDALVGREGTGLDLTFKTLQVSRTLCAAFSLGAGDTALRFAVDFARERVLYGRPVAEIPVVRRTLAAAFAELLVVDALASVACRALSVVPGEMSVISAVVKYVAPTIVDAIVREAEVVLGARGYLREGRYAAFQKLARDHAVVGLFDGSTAVNLFVISAQLPRLAEARLAEARLAEKHASPTVPLALFDLANDAAPFDWGALRLSVRGRDTLLADLPALTQRSGHGRALLEALQTLDRRAIAHASRADARQDDPVSFELAQHYALVYAGVAALAAWHLSRAHLPAELAGGEWVAVGLERLLARIGIAAPAGDEAYAATALALDALHARSQLFSLRPFRLAPALARMEAR